MMPSTWGVGCSWVHISRGAAVEAVPGPPGPARGCGWELSWWARRCWLRAGSKALTLLTE